MAKAKGYDDWEDAGMAFSSDELDAYQPVEWAQQRVARLCAMRQVVMRHLELPDIAKPLWWRDAAKWLRDKIGWYCTAMHLTPPTEEELGNVLPDRKTAAGKALSKEASLLDARDWLGAWAAETEAAMRYVVTIGRRASASCKWDAFTNKASNRLANCVNGELQLQRKLDETLVSRERPQTA